MMTQRGARLDFQAALRDQGVEVVEFDFLTPEAVAAYCYERGFLQVRGPPGAALPAVRRAGGAVTHRRPAPHADTGFGCSVYRV